MPNSPTAIEKRQCSSSPSGWYATEAKRFDIGATLEVEHTPDEFDVHSFIVKVWIEGDFTKHGDTTWHGRITHLPGGEQRYLRSLSEIEAFVEPYLKAAGIKFGKRERIKRWLSFKSST